MELTSLRKKVVSIRKKFVSRLNDCFSNLLISNGSNNRENRDIFRDHNRRCIQNPEKDLR